MTIQTSVSWNGGVREDLLLVIVSASELLRKQSVHWKPDHVRKLIGQRDREPYISEPRIALGHNDREPDSTE